MLNGKQRAGLLPALFICLCKLLCVGVCLCLWSWRSFRCGRRCLFFLAAESDSHTNNNESYQNFSQHFAFSLKKFIFFSIFLKLPCLRACISGLFYIFALNHIKSRTKFQRLLVIYCTCRDIFWGFVEPVGKKWFLQ